MACNLLLAMACGKESGKATGNLAPKKANLYGSWQFDTLSGDFSVTKITFKKGKGSVQDSLYFTANPGRGFLWDVNESTVEGTRYLEGYRRESVRMLINDLSINKYTDAEGNQVSETTMVVSGYFSETTLGNIDTVWNFKGNLKKL